MPPAPVQCRFAARSRCLKERGVETRLGELLVRMRPTVLMLVCRAVTISASPFPSSAKSRMRARVTVRALWLPPRSICRNASRSSSLNSTTYTFGRIGSSFVGGSIAPLFLSVTSPVVKD